MTHSHDTATPALSVESEYVLVPREPTDEMVDAGRIHGWDDPDHEGSCIGHPETREAIYRAMISAAPAPNPSPAAKGGEAVVVPYDDFHAAYGFVPRSKVSPDRCLKTRLRALLRAEDLAHADEAEALATPSPQPADAVRGARDHSTCTMGVGCETYGVCYADAAGKPDRCAALASDPAPAGEAVEPEGPFIVMASNYSRPFLLGCYETLEQAIKAQCGSPEKWDIFTRHPAPEDTARLREDLAEAVRQIEANIAAIERSKEFVQKATSLAQTAERERDDTRKALEDAALWHDAQDKAISKQPNANVGHNGWMRNEHQEQARTLRAAARSAFREGASDE